ncbi:AAA family ATPase [Lederbergia citrea]|uniref:ATP-binding protein n=1 Tax=Lederbergia citrea TaxID=2833581 RepID=A0A942Z4L2_9BACI|nr:ATP-binding protein [Lederbergia citrea]MBS4203416.1 ATP-binding protein [Lederbergia citrea]MBS4221911.1 ATP-binding protein [Lederbergia citrea]
MVNIATLHLMVGLPCSGKTTLARALEKKYSALRLTPDEWHIRLFGHDYGENMTESDEAKHDARHDTVESLMWDLAARVLVLNIDVILDFGCWVRSQRDEFRSRAKDLGAEFKIHFVDVSEELLFERLKTRNKQNPDGTFLIPEAKLKEWIQIFEPPSSAELE